jgi:hypothetical protein
MHYSSNISPPWKFSRPEEGELFHAEDQTWRNNVRFSELLSLDNAPKRHMSAACRMSGTCQAKLGRHVRDKLRIRMAVFCVCMSTVCQSSCLLRSRLIWWQAWKVISHRFKIILLGGLWKLLNCRPFCRKDYVINVLQGFGFSGLCLHVRHILWRMFVRNVGKFPPV